MGLGQKCRNYGFLISDALKGNPIGKRIDYLEDLRKKRSPNDEALKQLLDHAITTVPFYRNVSCADIRCFPVVSKRDYRENYQAFRSDGYSNESELRKVFTSGSTGTPFMALQDREKVLWHQAGLIALNRRIGWNVGDKFLFFRYWGDTHSGGKLALAKTNTIPVDVMNFGLKEMESVRQRLLRDKNLHVILGYATVLAHLSEYLIRVGDGPDAYGIKLVIADSEKLVPAGKEAIETAFKCPVFDRYGTNENGIFALKVDNSPYYINYPEYYIEVLDLDSDQPAKPGSLGRIVITDLYNKAFPFIRCDTGDLGIPGETVNGQCLTFSELSGRVSTALKDANGNIFSEGVAATLYEDMLGIGRYQLAQVGETSYQLRLEDTSRELDHKLQERTQKALGGSVEIVHTDIQKSNSGKYAATSYEVMR